VHCVSVMYMVIYSVMASNVSVLYDCRAEKYSTCFQLVSAEGFSALTL